MSQPRILFVSHDPGGISSLGPVIPATRRFAEVEVWLHPFSVSVYRGSCRAITSFAQNDVLASVRAAAPDLIVTGTSMEPDSIDKKVIDAAWHLGIPSIAFVDFWANYIERFTQANGTQVFPDMIATVDETAKAEMIAAGVPEILIEITGLTRLPPRGIKHMPNKSSYVLLFISQALSEIYGGDAPCRARIGYTQQDAFNLLAAALPAFEENLGRHVELWVRRHPKETPWAPRISHVIVNNLPADTCLAQADLVAGMTGSMLIDALFIGRPVVSFQPNLVGPDRLMPSRQGHVTRVSAAREALPALVAAAQSTPSLPASLTAAADGQAVERFVALMRGMLKQTFHRKSA